MIFGIRLNLNDDELPTEIDLATAELAPSAAEVVFVLERIVFINSHFAELSNA